MNNENKFDASIIATEEQESIVALDDKELMQISGGTHTQVDSRGSDMPCPQLN